LNLIIRKTGKYEYTLFSEKGTTLYVMSQCDSNDDAMQRASIWASSWNAVTIRIDNEQGK